MPSDFFHQRLTCRLCGSADLVLAVPLHATPIADAYVPADRRGQSQELFPLDLHRCGDCGHVQLLTVVDPEVLFRDYLYTTSVSASLREHFHRYAREVLARFACPRGALVLDIGSNDGTLLRFFQAEGLRVLGVDPAERIASQATAAGIPTLPVFFTGELAASIGQAHGRAALITANNVFAHSDRLGEMADAIRTLLADDGVFIFEVSYLLDIVDKLLFDTIYHEHLCYHSVGPLERFFGRHGLELFDVERLATKGGSLRAFVQRVGGPWPLAPAVAELVALEEWRGLARPQIFQEFASRIDLVRQELRELLAAARGAGRTVAGYGASATVTTLVYQLELAPYLDFLVDDNPARHGWFSPGQQLPIFHPRELNHRRVDDVVILAWQYAEPIIQRNSEFRERGGRFIIPLPQVSAV